MPSIDTQIWLALSAKVATVTTTPTLPVYDPDAAIPPPASGGNPAPFLLVSDARNDNQRLSIGGKVSRRSGTLMLSVQWPIALTVTHAQLIQVSGSIADQFPADTHMKSGGMCLRVTRDADAMQPYRDGIYHVAVVRVPWEVLYNRA